MVSGDAKQITVRDRAMAETTSLDGPREHGKLWKGVFAVAGIMSTLVTYGVLQVQIPTRFGNFVGLNSRLGFEKLESLFGFLHAGEDHESSVWG